MADTRCVADPMSDLEAELLRAYVANDTTRILQLATLGAHVELVRLVERGFLQKHERGMLVTPEGVAAALS